MPRAKTSLILFSAQLTLFIGGLASSMVEQLTLNQLVRGSIPRPGTKFAGLAQLVEHSICNRTVASSNLAVGSSGSLRAGFFMCRIAEAWNEGEHFFEQHGIANARSEVRWMLEFILGGQKLPLDQKLLSLKLNESLPINDAQLERFRNLLKRRVINREPLQYLLETMPFCDLTLKVDPRALIPRPETEELVAWVIAEIAGCDPKRILDLGTGTGAIALSLAKAFPRATVIAVDCDVAALSLAQENAHLNQLTNVEFLLSNWFQAVSGTFDCIVSNPPYLSEQEWLDAQPDVRDHEPKIALVSHDNGLSDLKKILSDAKHYLNDHANLFLETGPAHHPSLATHAQILGFKKTLSRQDFSGRDRFFMVE